MKIDILAIILIILILVIVVKIYYDSDNFQLTCIISGVDGNSYCVRDREKLKEKKYADHLAKVTNNLKLVVDDCKKNFPNQTNVKNLAEGFNPKKIVEVLPTSKYTAYSENKGEKLAFCLETEKNSDNLIDINTLTFVALHELAHIASSSVGHNDEFWNNFKFLLERAEKIGVYQPVDYKKKPKKYCGITIHDNPLYDL